MYPVKKSFRKKYALSGLLVYHDDNTTFWRKYIWGYGNDRGKFYNRIASHDLTIVWGKSAHSGSMANMEVEYESDGAKFNCKNGGCNISEAENNNFHVIPANKRLDKALSLLPRARQVPIYIEGYLTDWYGLGEYGDLQNQTALNATTEAKKRAGGRKTRAYYQLYLTKFVYDGYIFE